MNRLAIVYWSGTGNTEIMANAIAEGATGEGSTVEVLTASQFSASRLTDFDVIAFGCPAMGSEELEDSEFEPMFADVEKALSGKKIALFGSYGWGDGQWMRDWAERCQSVGAVVYDSDGLQVNETPDDAAQENCKELGKKLTSW